MAATQPCRRKNITRTELPLDVIFINILPRLPARSVSKYLSVSKQWYSFLKSPMFTNMHLNHATNDDHQNHHKLLVFVLYANGTFSYSNTDCETQEPGMSHRPLPFGHRSGDILIKSSCNGLVLVALRNSKDAMLSDLIIWNPLTTDYKTLSKPDFNILYYDTRFELYYNSSEEDYRVVLITVEKAVYIYLLKSDSWRKTNFQCIPNSIPLGWSPSTCWNEKLFFEKGRVFNSITMFDTKTEKFMNISTPFQDYWCSRFTVQRGCIHMCVKYYSQINHPYERCIKLWSMERIGVLENASTYTRVQDIDFFLEPLHLMRDGNWLMKPHKSCKYYYKVDLENKHNQVGPYFYHLDGFLAGVYIETFVSPNQYMN